MLSLKQVFEATREPYNHYILQKVGKLIQVYNKVDGVFHEGVLQEDGSVLADASRSKTFFKNLKEKYISLSQIKSGQWVIQTDGPTGKVVGISRWNYNLPKGFAWKQSYMKK